MRCSGACRRIFTEPQLRELVDQGVLGEQVRAHEVDEMPLVIKPQLAMVANPPRRDAWFNAVKARCRDFLEVFNYRHYALLGTG